MESKLVSLQMKFTTPCGNPKSLPPLPLPKPSVNIKPKIPPKLPPLSFEQSISSGSSFNSDDSLNNPPLSPLPIYKRGIPLIGLADLKLSNGLPKSPTQDEIFGNLLANQTAIPPPMKLTQSLPRQTKNLFPPRRPLIRPSRNNLNSDQEPASEMYCEIGEEVVYLYFFIVLN